MVARPLFAAKAFYALVRGSHPVSRLPPLVSSPFVQLLVTSPVNKPLDSWDNPCDWQNPDQKILLQFPMLRNPRPLLKDSYLNPIACECLPARAGSAVLHIEMINESVLTHVFLLNFYFPCESSRASARRILSLLLAGLLYSQRPIHHPDPTKFLPSLLWGAIRQYFCVPLGQK